MSRRLLTPAIASFSALAVLAAAGGIGPGFAQHNAPAERGVARLVPDLAQGTGPAPVRAATAVATAGERSAATGHGGGTGEALQSTSGQAVLTRYTGDAPSYVHSGSVTLVGLSFDHPVAGPFSFSSGFGWRANPTDVGPARQFHIGVDYAVACGTPVRAAADGTVSFSGPRGTGGLRLDVDHGGGLSTSYRHNSQLLVSPGETVSQGDVIALSGTTGNSTGCHLHFDAMLAGRYVDPALLLPSVPGQPRSLEADDLERIHAAADRDAPALSASGGDEAAADREASALSAAEDAADREAPALRTPSAHAGQAERPDASGPVARGGADRSAPARDETTTAAPKGREARPQASTPRPQDSAARQPSTKQSASGERTDPRVKPSEPTTSKKTNKDTSASQATDKTQSKPKSAQTSQPALTEPKPEPSDPTTPDPTEPEPKPEPTDPTTPEPTQPEPTDPTTPEPTPTEPTEPAESAERALPEPTETADPDNPDTDEPLPPEALSDAEAAQWCLPLEDGEESDIIEGMDPEDLLERVSVLDEAGEPQPITLEALKETSPTALWLDSLPACSDAEFLESALTARTAG